MTALLPAAMPSGNRPFYTTKGPRLPIFFCATVEHLPNMDVLDAHLIIIFSGLAFMCESLDIAKKYPIKMNSVKTINVTSKMR